MHNKQNILTLRELQPSFVLSDPSPVPNNRERRPSDYARRMRERLALRARIAEGDNDAKPMRNNLQIGFILLMIAAIVAFAMVMSSKI